MTDTLMKLSVGAPMELDDVMAAADAVPAMVSKTAEVRGIELQRIDRGPDTTVIFFTGGEESADAFHKAVEKGDRPARLGQVDRKELLSPEPFRD